MSHLRKLDSCSSTALYDPELGREKRCFNFSFWEISQLTTTVPDYHLIPMTENFPGMEYVTVDSN